MTRAAKIEFLRAKADLVLAQAANEQGRQSLLALFSWLRADPRGLSTDTIRRGDLFLQELMEVFNPDIKARMEDELFRRFGITQLAKQARSPNAVLEQVLRRASIPNDDAARLLQQVLDDTTNIQTLGDKTYRKLGAILDAYRSDASRRRKQ
jgi:hypothetical protein